jgi:hypothetical protein
LHLVEKITVQVELMNNFNKFIVPKSRTNSRKRTVLYRVIIAWNSVPSHIVQVNSKPGFKKADKATHQGTTPLPYLT